MHYPVFFIYKIKKTVNIIKKAFEIIAFRQRFIAKRAERSQGRQFSRIVHKIDRRG